MKKIYNGLLIVALALGFSSCKKYLDINTNTNSSTVSTPALVLPQAIVGSASITQQFNSAYYFPGGFAANIYGVGGYGAGVTYAYTASNFTGLFSSSYDNATDYQYVIDNTAAVPSLAYSTAIARIMKAFTFARLVDQYNDVPYSEALKGAAALTPKYDKAEDIYKDLVAQLTISIKAITTAQAGNVANAVVSSTDPLFAGKMDLWKKFANTLKLRLLIKMAGVPALTSYATTEFTALDKTVGFLDDDALVQPGYVKEAGRQNPNYQGLAFNADGTRSQGQAIPTKWILSFYSLANGGKLNDTGRGSVIYNGFPNTATNQLGEENTTSSQVPPTGSTSWYTGADKDGGNKLGVAKGPTQAQPIMLAAESKFLQAEAILRGYLTGDAKTAFNDGIKASFTYLFKNVSNVVDPSKNVTTAVDAYIAANSDQSSNPLVYLANYDITATPLATDYNKDVFQRRLEAIITQKYIAMNVINSDEAYNEYKRTDYPHITPGSTNAVATFASKQSVSTRPDKLIGRILYPQQEYNLNSANVPAGITLFGSRIFWDLN